MCEYKDRSCFNCEFIDELEQCCSNEKSIHEGDNVLDVLICGKWKEKNDDKD